MDLNDDKPGFCCFKGCDKVRTATWLPGATPLNKDRFIRVCEKHQAAFCVILSDLRQERGEWVDDIDEPSPVNGRGGIPIDPLRAGVNLGALRNR